MDAAVPPGTGKAKSSASHRGHPAVCSAWPICDRRASLVRLIIATALAARGPDSPSGRTAAWAPSWSRRSASSLRWPERPWPPRYSLIPRDLIAPRPSPTPWARPSPSSVQPKCRPPTPCNVGRGQPSVDRLRLTLRQPTGVRRAHRIPGRVASIDTKPGNTYASSSDCRATCIKSPSGQCTRSQDPGPTLQLPQGVVCSPRCGNRVSSQAPVPQRRQGRRHLATRDAVGEVLGSSSTTTVSDLTASRAWSRHGRCLRQRATRSSDRGSPRRTAGS